MKVIRIIFYFISILVIGEVTDIVSLYQKEATISFYTDEMENPLEEDETKEYEEDSEFLFGSSMPLPTPIEIVSSETARLDFELTEALQDITVPPPQS
ncbi:hypothetical protein BH09BAC3_BH09BAC3_30570 [soil metagenome]